MNDRRRILPEAIHSAACARGEHSYLDPETGYTVFTELYHRERGHCCKSGCRHCPYGDAAAKPDEDSSDSSS